MRLRVWMRVGVGVRERVRGESVAVGGVGREACDADLGVVVAKAARAAERVAYLVPVAADLEEGGVARAVGASRDAEEVLDGLRRELHRGEDGVALRRHGLVDAAAAGGAAAVDLELLEGHELPPVLRGDVELGPQLLDDRRHIQLLDSGFRPEASLLLAPGEEDSHLRLLLRQILWLKGEVDVVLQPHASRSQSMESLRSV